MSTNKVLVSHIDKDSLDGTTNLYALMFLLKINKIRFESQFVCIGHDWDVLICQDGHCKNRLAILNNCVFNDEFLQNLMLQP